MIEIGIVFDLLALVLAIIFVYLVLKQKSFLSVRRFVYRLFWIDKLQENQSSWINRMLLYGAKFFMLMYILIIPWLFLEGMFSLSLSQLVSSLVLLLIYPCMYRIVMGVQRIFHKV